MNSIKDIIVEWQTRLDNIIYSNFAYNKLIGIDPLAQTKDAPINQLDYNIITELESGSYLSKHGLQNKKI